MSNYDLDVNETLIQIDLLLRSGIMRRFVRIADYEDLRQNVFVAIFTEAEQYDAGRSTWPTFLASLIQSELHRFRLKKRWLKHQVGESIHDLEDEDHPLTNNYPMSELNDVERVVFCGEIRQAISELPGELQAVCQKLLLSSQRQAAQELCMKPKLLSQKISQIRKLFSDSKIVRDYL